MALTETLMDGVVKTMNVVHRAVVKVSGGRLGYQLVGMAAVELHTTGRKSGQRRSVMLTAPVFEDDRVVLIASKGGDPRHPDWFRNLTDDPDVEITHRGETRNMRARVAEGEERAELWRRAVEAYKHYDSYQKRTDREIPVVVLEPR
jgi:deazaflavin-dependent oxidoreductase (nitroreductase family)